MELISGFKIAPKFFKVEFKFVNLPHFLLAISKKPLPVAFQLKATL